MEALPVKSASSSWLMWTNGTGIPLEHAPPVHRPRHPERLPAVHLSTTTTCPQLGLALLFVRARSGRDPSPTRDTLRGQQPVRAITCHECRSAHTRTSFCGFPVVNAYSLRENLLLNIPLHASPIWNVRSTAATSLAEQQFERLVHCSFLVQQDMPLAYSSNVVKLLNLGIVGKTGSLRSSWNPPRRICSVQITMENGHCDNSRGSLIVLEGLDRSGKTSQSNNLVSFLKGKGLPVEAWHFPDRSTTVGGMISSYLVNQSQLDDRTIHLLFSANRWEKSSLMETKLRSGISLVVDRYSFSGVAFSAAKGLDIQWCKAPEEGLIAPDLVIYLDIPPEKAAERGGYGSERYERIDFQRNVANHYKSLCDNSWKIIDACLPVKDIESRLRDLALECILSCQNGKPLSKLRFSK